MNNPEIGVHQSHCCILHGCKYAHEDCPVVNKEVKQDHPCEACWYNGIKETPDPSQKDYDLYEKIEVDLRNEVLKLRNAIRSHKNGDMNNSNLYSLLPENTNLIPKKGIWKPTKSEYDLQLDKQKNNPNNEPTGPYTGRCQYCGSKDLWDDNTAYGCNNCNALLGL